MDAETLRTDPIGALLDMDGDSAKIVPDPVNGYDRIIPNPDILDDMADMYASAIESTDKDYAIIWQKQAENEKTYECISDQGETITLPIAKRIINQQVAWQSTQILTKDPIISVKPIDGGSYTIPAQVVSGDPSQPGSQFQTQTLTAEQASKLYEAFLQYKLTERIEFEQLVEDTVQAIHVGEAPTWWKVYYEPKKRAAKRRKFAPIGGKGNVVFMGLEDTSVVDGETVRMAHLSNRMVTMPVDCQDEQAAPWLAERQPLTNTDIWEGVKNGSFDLCLPEGTEITPDVVRGLLGFAENPQDKSTSQQLAEIDMRVAQNPTFTHDTRVVWFFYPIKRTIKIQSDAAPNADGSPATVEQETVEVRSLCGLLHVKARRFLNMTANPYWHGKRPYVPFFMRKRAHRFSGSTSAGDIAPIQRLVSSIFHLQIQNGVQQNVKVFLIRNNSATWRFFKEGNQLKPGLKIPYDDKDDVKPVQLGSPVQPMTAEISFLTGEADRLAVERDYTDVPNRTAAATIAQVEQLAKMQPQTILRGIRRRISRAIEMYLSTVAQYHIYETIPFLDEEQNKLTQKLISFPQDAIENHFAFHVTATGDEDSAQAKIEKNTILLQQTDAANEAALHLGDIAFDPRVPPPQRKFALQLLIRRELLFGELVRAVRPDYARFMVSETQAQQLAGEADQLFQQLQQQAAQNPPPAPPPNVNVSIKGELTPDQEQAIIAPLTGGQSAHVPPANGGGAVPNPQAGGGGPSGVQGQPGGVGVGGPPPPSGLPSGAPPVGVQ